ncbi:MAG TPA: hypothetical protein VGH74_05940, partial [Planctomycetaceae bacterium]
MSPTLEQWLQTEAPAVDYYQLLGMPRFLPDRAALLEAIRTSEWELAALLREPADPVWLRRARRLQMEFQQAARTFSDDRAWQTYDDAVLARMRDQYSIEAAGEPDAWTASHVRHWLEGSQGVAPGRLDLVQAGFMR